MMAFIVDILNAPRACSYCAMDVAKRQALQCSLQHGGILFFQTYNIMSDIFSRWYHFKRIYKIQA